MVNPAMFGVSPQQMEKAKEVGIELVTSCDLSPDTNIINPDPQIRKKGIEILKKFVDVKIRFSLINPGEPFDLGEPVDNLCDQLAWGFGNMFDIKGKIVDVE